MSIPGNLGYIRQAAFFPCQQPNPILIAEAGINAIFPVLLSAVTFGCRDIVKMRAGISPWHSRGMRALIEGAIKADEKALASGLLKFTIPIEKALFFFFVVDLTIEFVARWQSQIFKLDACGDHPNDCEFWGDTPLWFSYPSFDWNPLEYINTHDNGNCHFSLRSSIVVPAGCFWALSFDITPQASFVGGVLTMVSTRITRHAPDFWAFPQRDHEPAWFGNQFIANDMRSGNNKHTAFEVYEMWAKADVAAVAISGSVQASISTRPVTEDSIIPVNCFGKPIGHRDQPTLPF